MRNLSGKGSLLNYEIAKPTLSLNKVIHFVQKKMTPVYHRPQELADNRSMDEDDSL